MATARANDPRLVRAEGVFWQGGDARWRPEDLQPLTRTVRAQVCVVGGGFTGLWAALHIKRLAPAADVALVEREYCGAGASGRNGGWVDGWERILPGLVKRFGADRALWLVDASRRAVDDVRDTVEEGRVDCDLGFAGGLAVAASPAQLPGVLKAAVLARDLGRDDLLEVLTKDQARAMWGSPFAQGGVLVRAAGSVQPSLLVQGLRRLAVEAGVAVFEASPMIALERDLPAVVRTPAGAVVADSVVLASGARLARVPELRRTIFVIPSHIVVTAPSAPHLDALGWVRGRPFSDGRTAVHYGQRTADDRIVFGRGGGRLGYAGHVIPAHFHDQREADAIVADLRALLPSTRDLRVEWYWGGPVDRTQHGLPWVGTLGRYRNVHYGVGYGGNGVAPSNLIGRTLASVALGLRDEYAESPLVSEPPSYLPPEPARSAGAVAVRRAIMRCEELEDRGLKPDAASRTLRRCLNLSMPKGPSLPDRWRRD